MIEIKVNILEQIFGCYFHQDWTEEFDSDDSALQAIIDSEPSSKVHAAIEEINTLLESDLSENELKDILINKSGCFFDPKSVSMTYTQWLEKVRDVFEAI